MKSQAVESMTPEQSVSWDGAGIVAHLNRLEGSVDNLHSVLSDLVQQLSPVMYNRAWPGGPHVTEDVSEEACGLAKNIHDTHKKVIHALNVVTALNNELHI